MVVLLGGGAGGVRSGFLSVVFFEKVPGRRFFLQRLLKVPVVHVCVAVGFSAPVESSFVSVACAALRLHLPPSF